VLHGKQGPQLTLALALETFPAAWAEQDANLG
jgi:hypothetical protein